MRTKEFRLFLTILLALLGMQAKAEDKVVIQPATIEAGAEFDLPVELINERTYKAFQMDVVLPEGITPALTSRGKLVTPTKDPIRMEDTDHSIAINYVEADRMLKLV